MNRFAAVFSVVVMCVTTTHGDEVQFAHTTVKTSTLATDVTTYFKGDAKAFNSALAALADEYPTTQQEIPVAGTTLQPSPKFLVYVFKGTGKEYFNKCIATEAIKGTVVLYPLVPEEVISKSKPVFDFDWIVTKSSNLTDRQVSVILFAGGGVDLFDCELPANVAIRICRHR